MKLNNEGMLSEAISYYNDFEGELEESLFDWLVKRAKKAEEYEFVLSDIAEEEGTWYGDLAGKALK